MKKLITCPECGKQLSIRAAKCPHCGYVIPNKTCPKCKEVYNALLEECPSCGFNPTKAAEEAKRRAEEADRKAAEAIRLLKEQEQKEAEEARIRAEKRAAWWEKNKVMAISVASILSVIIICLCLPFFIRHCEINNIRYELNGFKKEATIKGNTFGGNSVDVVIPETIKLAGIYKYKINRIGKEAFIHNDMKSISISKSIVAIDEGAFAYCHNLTSITIPENVVYINRSAFKSCRALQKVTLKSNAIVSKNENYAFLNLFGKQVKEYIIGESVTSIGEYVFQECDGMTSITIPRSVSNIGWGAFNGCRNLKAVYISDLMAWLSCSLISNPLENDAILYVDGCEVSNLVIPEGVTQIKDNSFRGCSSIHSVYIPNSVTSIGECAFSRCENLSSITIPNSVTRIGNQAFHKCTSLKSITIPNSVTSIGWCAFWDCPSIRLPERFRGNSFASKSVTYY